MLNVLEAKVQNTDVVILCGGKGARLQEETQSKPKPMAEIGNRPILWHIMKYYASFGFKRFILALGYKAEHIKKYFLDYRLLSQDFTVSLDPKKELQMHTDSDEQNWEVVCIDTGLDTLKGSRVKQLEPYIHSEHFHLTYGDGLGNVDLNALYQFHLKHGKTATVTAVRPPSRFGEMVIEGDVVKKFEEKPQLTSGYINGGFFVFHKRFLKCLSADSACDLEFGALQNLTKDYELMTFQHDGYWQCMDTRRDLDYLKKLWMSQSAPWKMWKD